MHPLQCFNWMSISSWWPVLSLQLQLGRTCVWAGAAEGLHGGPRGLQVCSERQHRQHSSDPGHLTEEQSTRAGQSQRWGHCFEMYSLWKLLMTVHWTVLYTYIQAHTLFLATIWSGITFFATLLFNNELGCFEYGTHVPKSCLLCL